MLALNNINKTFKDRSVIKDFSKNFNKGSSYGLYGPNGSGKTTLLKIILNQIIQDEGEVLYESQNLDIEITPVSYMDNNRRSFFLRISALDNLYYFASLNQKNSSYVDEFLDQLKGVFNLNSFIRRPMNEISLGQIQLINIIRGLMVQPKILLFDEVFSSLDKKNKENFLKFIQDYFKVDKEIISIFCSHDEGILKDLTEEIIFLK